MEISSEMIGKPYKVVSTKGWVFRGEILSANNTHLQIRDEILGVCLFSLNDIKEALPIKGVE
jgi:hypothetical protein